MKKIISLFACALLLLSVMTFSSCLKSQGDAPNALNISGAQISDELFSYYIGVILHDPPSFGVDGGAASDVTEQAVSLCKNYVAVNTMFDGKGLRLTSELKHNIAESVSADWGFYKNYYKKADISKQTLTKALTAEAKKKMLFLHLYDKGGEREIDEDELLSYFTGNYVSFNAINGYFTEKDESGNIVQLPDDERSLIKNKFTTMLSVLKSGGTFDEVYRKYASEQQISSFSPGVMTINKSSNNYPTGFFDYVSGLAPDSPEIFETKDYIFIVSKTEKNAKEQLDSYRFDCLKAMRSDDFDSLLSDITVTYTAAADKSLLKSLYETVSGCF